MSKQVDERVVEMKFDNSNFESNVKTTMSTLDKLKASLNLKGASKGLEEINTAAKNTNVSGIGTAVDTVQAKFSALSVVGVTALANITNSAVNAGKRITKALTIDPITTGFQEYELKMDSVQTIMASSGASLETVNDYLAELNTYADKTIYSFSDMTSNIGKFTNAGVKLKDAVAAIKGVSNEAAVSGANANEASRAMYNFAQALSAGYVKLIDWKSIENANMATVEFKNELLKTALAVGTVVKQNGKYITTTTNAQGKVSEAFTATTMFNESLAHQWMTTEVLTKTLGRYADETTKIGKKAYAAAQDVKTATQLFDTLKEAAQSGWAETWELIVGDFNQAKEFYTYLSEVFGGMIDSSAKSRNALLKQALGDENSNWDKFSKKLKKAGVSVKDFQKALIQTGKKHGVITSKMIKDAGGFEKSLKSGWLSADIITETLDKFVKSASKSSKATEDMNAKLKKFQKVVDEVWSGSFGNGEKRIKALTEAGYNYKEVQDLVNKTVDGHRLKLEDLSTSQLKSVGYTDKEIKKLKELAAQAKETGTPLNELIQDMTYKPSGRELLIDSIKNILDSINKIVKTIKDAWEKVFPTKDKADVLYSIIEGFHDFTESLQVTDKTLGNVSKTLEGFFYVLKLFGMLSGGVVKTVITIANGLKRAFDLDFWGLMGRAGEMIKTFYNWIVSNNALVTSLRDTGNKILDFIEKTIDGIKEWIANFLALENTQKFITKFSKAISKTFENLKTWFNGLVDLFSAFIEQIKSIQTITFDDVVNAFKTLVENIVKHFLNIGSVFSNIGTLIGNFAKSIVEYFKIPADAIGGFGQKIIDFLISVKEKLEQFVDFSKLASLLLAGGLIVIIVKLLGLVNKMYQSFIDLNKAKEGMFKAIGGMFSSIGKAAVLKAKAEAVKTFAIAIAILAGSILVLSRIPQEGLIKAGATILGLAVIIGALAAVIGKFGPKDLAGSAKAAVDFGKFALAILAITSSLLILTFALKQLESLDPNKGLQIALGLVGMVAAIAAIMVAFGYLVKGEQAANMAKAGLMLIALSAALLIMTTVLKQIAKLDDSGIEKAATVLTGLGLFLAGLLVISKIGKDDVSKVGSMLLKVAAALLIMTVVIKLVSGMNPSELNKGITVITLFSAIIVGLMAATKLVGKGEAVKIGSTILAISAALLILVGVVKLCGLLSPSDILKGVLCISLFGLIVVGLAALTRQAGGSNVKMFATILSLSLAIGILGGICILLGLIDLEALAKGITAVGMLSTFMALMVYAAKGVGDCKGTMVAMAAAIAVMAVAIIALSFVDTQKLVAATAALTILMGMFALLTAATKYATSAYGTLIMLTAVVAALGGILYLLSGLPVESTLTNAAGLSVLLLSMSAACWILSGAGPAAMAAMPAVGVMLLIVIGVATILGVMAKFNIQASLETAAAISVLLLAMSASCLILAGVGPVAGMALAGIGVLAALVLGVGTLMVAIGALATNFPQLEEFLNKGIPLLEAIGNGLGSFFGGIVGGFISGVADGLAEVGTALSDFMTNLKPFLDGAKSVDESTVTSIKYLAEALLMITGASFINGIASILSLGSSDLGMFGMQLAAFGKSLVTFSDTVSGKIDEEAITAAANAGKVMAELQNKIVPQFGVVQVFTGHKDLGVFGAQLATFGGAIVTFSNTLTQNGGVNEKAITAAANAGSVMVELQNKVVPQFGLIQLFTGSQDLATFGQQLALFGSSIVAFSNSLTQNGGINEEAITAAANAGATMAELQSKIDPIGGVIEFFTGTNNLATFGAQLVLFGKAMKSYSDSVKDLDPGPVESSIKAANALVELSNLIGSDGKDKSIFDKLKDAVFPEENPLVDFGETLNEYGKSISNVDVGKINTSIIAAKSLVNFINGLSTINTSGISDFKDALDDLGEVSFDNFVSSFQKGAPKVSGAITKMLNTALMAASSSTSRFRAAGTAIVNALASSIMSKGSVLKAKFVALIGACVNTVKAHAAKFRVCGVSLITQLTQGFLSKSAYFKLNITNMLTSAKDVIRGYYYSFETAGKYLGDGLIDGIEAKEDAAYQAGYKLGQKSAQGVKDGAKEESPSKLTRQYGVWMGEGLILGIQSMGKKAYDAGNEMGDKTVRSISSAISKISDMVDSDIDAQPTIRPVIDLSDVKSGASTISDLFSAQQMVTATANVNAINSMSTRNRQNGYQEEVVSAINKLRKDLGNIEKPSYNIGNIAYDDGSAVSNAIETLVQAARIERRV